MSDHTQAYFDYKTTTRVVLGAVVVVAMTFSMCAYSWESDVAFKLAKNQSEKEFRKDMFDHGYQQVLKPCVPTGELIWEKKP